MNLEDCKEGARVCWYGRFAPPDSGIIISQGGSIWCDDNCNGVWVKWSSGHVSGVTRHELTLEELKEESKTQAGSTTPSITVNANVPVQLGNDITVWTKGADELFVLVKGQTQPYRMKADSNGSGLHVSIKDMQIKDYDGCKGIVLK